MLSKQLSVKTVLLLTFVLFSSTLFANSSSRFSLISSDSTTLDSTTVFAGVDTILCAFTYELRGNQNNGNWRVDCADSQGFVSFENAETDTTLVKVSTCGEYAFLYEVLIDSCLVIDTVHVKFENPSSSFKTYDLNIELELAVVCPEPDTVCGNEISIPGITEPNLIWNFYGDAACYASLFTAEPGSPIDFCLVEDISYNVLMKGDLTLVK